MTATDINDDAILNHIRRNVARNSHLFPPAGDVMVAPLDFVTDTSLLDREQFDLVLAGDVIYDDIITANFISFIEKLTTLTAVGDRSLSIVIATEKRYVFTVADLDTMAPAFDFFMEQLALVMQRYSVLGLEFIDINFPQYFCYERTADLVLIKLSMGRNYNAMPSLDNM